MKRVLKNVGSTSISDPDSLLSEVHHTITSKRLIVRGDVLIIGVSGGPDSTALLHLLYELRHLIGFKIIVAHFNHRMRPEAVKDERFVLRTAQALGLKCVCARAKERPPNTGSLEDWARRQRFDFLLGLAVRHKADAVALAHTADDLAETVLMRVLRGSGLLGLKGMGEEGVIYGTRFIRPLLSITKRRLLDYLRELRMVFCEDLTNRKTDFLRNKIRLKLLPLLNKDYNANIVNSLVHLSRSVADDYEFLFQEASKVFPKISIASKRSKSVLSLDVQKIQHIHPSLKRIILRMAFERFKGDLNQLTFDHIEAVERLLLKSSGAVDLPGCVVVKKQKERLCFSHRET